MNFITPQRQGRKVIHVVQHLAPGGLENLTLDLLNFAHQDDNVLIVSLEGNKEQALINWPKLKTYQNQLIFLEKKPGIRFDVILTLIKAFKGVRPDVVHTHHIGPLLYAGYAARIAKVPVRIHTEHDVWHLNNKKHVRLQGMILKAAKPTLVADATQVKDKLLSHFSYPNTVVIKNGIDCQKFKPGSKEMARERFNLPLDKQIIGTAGRLETVKGHDVFINAIKQLPKDTLAIIAGQGSQMESLAQQASSLGLQDQIRFLGLVDDMPHFYQALDLFCLPSRFEGFPLSPLESQACNTPAIVSDVGACSETICPETGAVFSAEDSDMLALLMKKMLRPKLATSPREFVVKNNDIRTMVKQYEALAMGELA